MRLRSRRPDLQRPATILVLAITIGAALALASTECQLQFESDGNAYPFDIQATLTCTGDIVDFTVGEDFYNNAITDGPVNLSKDDLGWGSITLQDAEDVTFTSLVLRNYPFTYREYALKLVNCRRCVLQNVVIDGIVLDSGVHSAILIEDSDVVIDGGTITGLGQMYAPSDYTAPYRTNGAALIARNSEVTLRNVQFGSSFLPADASAVTAEGGSLLVSNCAWQDLTKDVLVVLQSPSLGLVVSASGGASVTLQGCTVAGTNMPANSEGGIIYVSSGASVIVDTDNRFFVDPDLGNGVVMLADGAGSLALDGSCIYMGSPEAALSLPAAIATLKLAAIVRYHTDSPLLLSNLAVLLQNSRAQFNGGSLLRLYATNGSSVHLSGVSFANLVDLSEPVVYLDEGAEGYLSNVSFLNLTAALSMPLMRLKDAGVTLEGCTFASITASDVGLSVAYQALVVDAASSNVDIRNSTFRDLSWSHIDNTQVLHITGQGRLRISDSSISGVGGSCTAIHAEGGSSLELVNVNITDIAYSGVGFQQAAVIVREGSSLIATKTTWQRINALNGTGGAALTVFGSTSAALTGCTFADITGPKTAAVLVGNMSEAVVIKECVFQNITATPAVSIEQLFGPVSFSDTTFTSCQQGGALKLRSCGNAVQMASMTFTDNSNALGAGAAFEATACNITVDSSLFQHNTADGTGGAVSIGGSSTLQLTDCAFTLNTAQGSGGAVHASSSGLSVVRCSFTANTVKADPDTSTCNGGGISAASSELVLINSTFSRNFAQGSIGRGGAVSCTSSKATLSSVTLLANSAGEAGGALYAYRTPVTMQDSVVVGNSALTGAGVHIYERDDSSIPAAVGTFFPSSSQLPPTPLPPGILLSPNPLPATIGQSSNGNSTTIYAFAKIVGCSFTQNECTGATVSSMGGALAAVRLRDQAWSLYVQGSTFVGNSCPYGGAMTADTLDVAVVYQCDFRLNRARSSGGAINLQVAAASGVTSHAVLDGNSFLDNWASVSGGAVVAQGSWSLAVNNNTFTDNGNLNDKLSGGAVYLQDCVNIPSWSSYYGKGNAAFVDNVFRKNRAQDGAGIFARSCNVTAWNDVYIGNQATVGGGALCAENLLPDPITFMQLVEVYAEGNTALAGGAVHSSGQGLIVTGSSFADNKASGLGGALAVLNASPFALQALQRTTVPYYSSAEEIILALSIVNTSFTGNMATSGGGAIYMEASRMDLQLSNFISNTAGNGLQDNDWSDGGGAIRGESCFRISNGEASYFKENAAKGGPAGAVLLIGCGFMWNDCSFVSNTGTTFGGALAAAGWRGSNSGSGSEYNLAMQGCTFTKNEALTKDGGAVYAREVNTTAHLSRFLDNQAAGSGGAMALDNNIGIDLRSSVFENNTADQYGGAAYLLTAPVVYIVGSTFLRNYAARSGGALSIVRCNCTVTAATMYDGNRAGTRGGALHLQTLATIQQGDVNSIAESGNCVGQYLAQVQQSMSAKGFQLLGITEANVESYNATIVYGGVQEGYALTSLFYKGGVVLPVPHSAGPSQILEYEIALAAASGSSMRFAPGSTLSYANWQHIQILQTLSDTRVAYKGTDAGIDVAGGQATVYLAAGSAITSLMPDMEVPGDVSWTGATLTSRLTDETPVIAVIPAARSMLYVADGRTVDMADWNRYVILASSLGTFLYDTFGGTTDTVDRSSILDLGTGSSVTPYAEATEDSGGMFTVSSGSWVLANGTALAVSGSLIAFTVIPASGSTVSMAAGSTAAVPDWNTFILRVSGNGTSLYNPALDLGTEVASGASLVLAAGSTVTTISDRTTIVPAGSNLQVQGKTWSSSIGLDLVPSDNIFAIGLPLPAGSNVRLNSSYTVGVQERSRYLLWSGPLGTLLHDAGLGVVHMLPDTATVSVSRTAFATSHDDAAMLRSDTSFTIQLGSWVLSNGTSLTFDGSKLCTTALLAVNSHISSSNSMRITDWYRYLIWAGQGKTYLYDTTDGTSSLLGEGTTVSVAVSSFLIVHESLTQDLTGNLTVQDSSLELGNGTILSPTNVEQKLAVQPASGSTITFSSAADTLTTAANRHILWIGLNGTRMYDTALHVSYSLVEASTVELAEGSRFLRHDSSTTILPSDANLTVNGSTWQLSTGASFSLNEGVLSLLATPASSSKILFTESYTLSLSGSNRYYLLPGKNGTALYDDALRASYVVAEGSTATLAPNSIISGSPNTYLGSETSLEVRDGAWQLGTGQTIHPSKGWRSRNDSALLVYTASTRPAPFEIARSCAADFSTARYQADPYAFRYAAVKDLMDSLSASDFSETNISPRVAAAAYGYASAPDASGFNASLLVSAGIVGVWDDAGQPSSVQLTCTASTVSEELSYARGLGVLLMDMTAVNNTAAVGGGAVAIDGGYGRLFMDGAKISHNSVEVGDGGGLALLQDEEEPNTKLEVFVISSVFASNDAVMGAGGGVLLATEDQHQQAIFLNTTIDGNTAAFGGGIAVLSNVSVAFHNSSVTNNRADSSQLSAISSAAATDANWGNGGGIMASLCNELQLNSETQLSNNSASSRGGGLSATSCGILLINGSTVEGNTAQSGGGAYLWNDLPVGGELYSADSSSGSPIGASIAIVHNSSMLGNAAVNSSGSGSSDSTVSDGFGGGFLVRGHVSTLLAASYFEGNNADVQGGSIFIESQCDLDASSLFLSDYTPKPTAFPSAHSLFNGTVRSLRWPRPKGCWGTVVYLPQFKNNEAVRSGGALFASHPEALSLVCADSLGSPDVAAAPSTDESTLAGRVLVAMQKASYQVLNNTIVQNCYKNEIQQIYNISNDDFKLSGSQLSTLEIADNRAKGYGYLIAIIPSKLRILGVSWAGNTSNIASTGTGDITATTAAAAGSTQDAASRRALLQLSDPQQQQQQGDSTTLASSSRSAISADKPGFQTATEFVFDNDTQVYRQVTRYHVTAYSSRPMDLPVQLLDALDQVASENTTLRQADVQARFLYGSNGCAAELLGGTDAIARNGTAVLSAVRLRALKGENYSIELTVQDSVFSGTVEPLLVHLSVPACSLGEVPRDGGYLCEKCDPRSFSLWQDTEPLVDCAYPDLPTLTCAPCPAGAECPGGALLIPRAGFWHSAANSSAMNECPNSEACRGDDDDAQEALVSCQEWWYSRPVGFDYQAYVDSVLAGDASQYPDAPGALPDGSFNASDPALCLLWGLPYDHPVSYMKKQCTEGYGGNLCAVCMPVDGKTYAVSDDFECSECYPRSLSSLINVLAFLANVVTVLAAIWATFGADYTQEEDLAVGDLGKVVITHIQFLGLVTRLHTNWPQTVTGLTSAVSAVMGAVIKAYSPSCMLPPGSSPADAARIDQLTSLLAPLLCVLLVASVWLLRYWLFNTASTRTQLEVDMRTIEEFQRDRARRLASKRQASDVISQVGASPDKYGVLPYEDTEDYEPLDLRASELVQEGGKRVGAGSAQRESGVPRQTEGGEQGRQNGAGAQLHAEPANDGSNDIAPGADDGSRRPSCSGGGSSGGGSGSGCGSFPFPDCGLGPSHIAIIIEEADPGPIDRSNTPEIQQQDTSPQPRLLLPGAAPAPSSSSPPHATPFSVTPFSADCSDSFSPRSRTPTAARPAAPGASDTAPGGTVGAVAEVRPSSAVAHATNGKRGTVEAGAGGEGAGEEAPAGPCEGNEGTGKGEGREGVDRGREEAEADRGGKDGCEDQGEGERRGEGGKGGGEEEGGGRRVGGSARVRGSSGRVSLVQLVSSGRMWVRDFFTYKEEEDEAAEGRWAALANIDRTMAWWRQELLVVMIACFILYPAWAQASLQIFACYLLDDGTGAHPEYQRARWSRGYWLLNMNQECYAGEHARLWVPIGVVCVALICLGIPLLNFMVMWTHRNALRTVHVTQTYGFLYRRYNPGRYWWEAVLQLQTLVVVLVDVFGRVRTAEQQGVLYLLALLVVMWSNMYFEPLKHRLLERTTSLSLLVLATTVVLGLFCVQPADGRDAMGPGGMTAIGAVIVVLNVGLVCYFLNKMYRLGQQTLHKRLDAARTRVAEAAHKVQQSVSDVRKRISSAGAFSLRIRKSISALGSLRGRGQLTRRRTPAAP